MNAKEKLFEIMDRIVEIESIPEELRTEKDKLELRHLEVMRMEYYSQWKD